MFASMWSYPWDFVDCGVDAVLDELCAAGIGDVSLTTAYHAGRFLQVRSPGHRAYFPEDGVLYYPSGLERFRGLKLQPVVGELARQHPDFFPRLAEKAQKRGMTVSGWTVCLHNARLGYAHPDACVHSAFGDVAYFNQCPANDDVREYLLALVEDVDRSLPLETIQLESMNYMGFAHEYHHEKDGVGLTPYEDFLLSLCFCESCMKKGREAGVDMEGVRESVRRRINLSLNRDRAKAEDRRFLEEGPDFFRDETGFREYLLFRSRVVSSLMAEARGRVKGAELWFLSLLARCDSWLFGVDLAELSRHADGIVICSYDCDEFKAARDVRASREAFEPGTKLITGLRAFHPEYPDEAAFLRKVRAVLGESRDGFLFYNYGLIPERQLGWVATALRECGA